MGSPAKHERVLVPSSLSWCRVGPLSRNEPGGRKMMQKICGAFSAGSTPRRRRSDGRLPWPLVTVEQNEYTVTLPGLDQTQESLA